MSLLNKEAERPEMTAPENKATTQGLWDPVPIA